MAGTVRKRSRANAKGEIVVSWLADYFDQHGKRHNRTCATQKEAKAWLLRAQSEVRDGIHSPLSSSVTVAEAGALWLAACEAEGLERSTIRRYEGSLRNHIAPVVGEMRLAELTPPMVEAYRDIWLGTLSRSEAMRTLKTLKCVLKEAQRRSFVVYNAAAASRIAPKTRGRARLEIGRDIPSREDVQAVVAAAPERWRPLLITAAFTGMRSSELRGLHWPDVDFAVRKIHVRQRADGWGVLGPPKSAKSERSIPMSPKVFQALRQWRMATGGGAGGLVFSTPHHNGKHGMPLSVGLSREVFYYAQRRAGLAPMLVGAKSCSTVPAKYTFHALRHFFASIGIEAGFPPKRLQELLGHASIKMTYDVYGHLFPDPEDDQARFAAMERAVFGDSA